MQALRKSCRVLGPGQKSRVGRLGAGAAVGAIVAGFSTPVLAQYAVGGGTASGVDTVAIGPSSSSTGDGAISIGNGNTVDTYAAPLIKTDNGILDRTTGTTNLPFPVPGTTFYPAGIGIGQDNTVDAGGIAIGTQNQSNNATNTTLAIGLGNIASGAYGSAIGVGNAATATSASAFGTANTASGNTAIAVGRQNTASGLTSIAMGNVATASQINAIAIGHSTQATGAGSIAIGGGVNGASTNFDATATEASGTNAVAIGTASAASGITSFAGGSKAVASGASSVALGNAASASKTYSIAIGESAVASTADNTTAIGRNASSTGLNGIALGLNSRQTGGGIAAGNDTASTGLVATSLGYRNSAAGDLSTAVGASNTATGKNSVALGVSTTSGGASSIAIGDGAQASAANTIAIGTGNIVTGANSGAIGDPNSVSGTGSYALGNNNTVAADNAFAIGNDITIAAGLNGAVGIGNASTVAAAVGTSTATVGTSTFGGFAGAAPVATVSVGSAGSERTITNVAAGRVTAGSTDAINASQLFSLATVVDVNTKSINTLGNSVESITGAGTQIGPDGSLTKAPAFVVGGATYNNVGAALTALDAGGLVKQTGGSPGTGQITVGATTQGTSVSFANSDAVDRVLTGVAAGATTAASNEAINGSQMFAGMGSVATSLGGGSKFDPTSGTVTAPSYAIGGTTYSDVGSALGALANGGVGPVQYANSATPTAPNGGTATNNLTLVGAAAGPVTLDNVKAGSLVAGSAQAVNGGQINTLGTSIATSIGGTAAFDPLTGGVSGTAITVDGTVYTDITTAIQAAGGGLNVTTAATGTGVANGTTLTNVGPGGTTTFTAGNNIISTQTGGNVAFALNPVVTGLTSVAITGGPTISATGITGLAAGNIAAGSTDAVNGGQIYALANALGTPVGPGGAVTPPSYAINGNTYGNVGGALAAVDTALTGGGIKYFHTNSTLADSAPLGADSVAIGPVSGSAGTASVTIGLNTNAAGTNAIALGNGASAAGNNTIAIGTGNQVSGNNSGAFGDPNIVTGNDSYALGNNNTVAADKAFAIGNNISIAAGQTGSVGIGDGSTVSAANTGAYSLVGGTAAATAPTAVVSVGSAGGERQVTNVAAGVVSATSTDAVNRSQLFLAETATKNMGTSIGSLIGAGTKIAADGTVMTAPSFNLRGATYNDINSALIAVASGGTGPVQYSDAATPTVPNGANPSQNFTLVGGAAGVVSLTNLAAGKLSATSTDAVNGAQLFAVQTAADGALQRSGGTMTGAINMGGNAITNLAGPVAATDAANKAYVDGKAGLTDELGKTTAAALGAGSTYDPATGKLSAPSYSVGGKTYASTGAALAATNALAVQYVADSNGAPTNAVRLTGNGNGQAVALGNVAPGVVAAGSLDAVNGGQLHTVQVLASNSLQYDRNPNGSTNFGSVTLGGASATAPTALHNVAQGVAANDAVNVLQLSNAQTATLGLANAYTDKAFGQLAFDLGTVAKRAYAGTAAAIALQAPALFQPGTVAMRGGMGYYRGEFAMGLSVRATSDNGRWSLTGGVSGGKHGGVAASAGIDFVLGSR